MLTKGQGHKEIKLMTKGYILAGDMVNKQVLLNNTELRLSGLIQVPNPCQEKSSVWGWSAEARSGMRSE